MDNRLSARGYRGRYPACGESMSARGSFSLGKRMFAESKRLIPVSWFGFMSGENLSQLQELAPVEIDRKTALANFAANEQFLSTLTKGKLNFQIANEKLVEPIQKSRAKSVAIDIAELLDSNGMGPGIDLLINSIANQNLKTKFELPEREVENPMTGDMVKVRGIKLKNTQEILFSICWITDHDLKNDQEYLDELVTGYLG